MFDKLIFNASTIAARLHDGQYRKDGLTPNIVHPARTAESVSLATSIYATVGGVCREFMVASAWCHDTIEDTPATAESLLESGLPGTVVDIVVALTNDKSLKDKGVKRNDRKIRMAERLAEQPEYVRLIKLADRLDNVMGLDALDPDFAKLYVSETRMLVDALLVGPMNSGGMALASRIEDCLVAFERGSA